MSVFIFSHLMDCECLLCMMDVGAGESGKSTIFKQVQKTTTQTVMNRSLEQRMHFLSFDKKLMMYNYCVCDEWGIVTDQGFVSDRI